MGPALTDLRDPERRTSRDRAAWISSWTAARTDKTSPSIGFRSVPPAYDTAVDIVGGGAAIVELVGGADSVDATGSADDVLGSTLISVDCQNNKKRNQTDGTSRLADSACLTTYKYIPVYTATLTYYACSVRRTHPQVRMPQPVILTWFNQGIKPHFIVSPKCGWCWSHCHWPDGEQGHLPWSVHSVAG